MWTADGLEWFLRYYYYYYLFISVASKKSIQEGLKDNHVEGGSGGLPFRKNCK